MEKLRIRVTELLTQVSETKFQSNNTTAASYEKEKSIKSDVKRECFRNEKIIEEESFHAGLDFRCNITFEDQQQDKNQPQTMINGKE